MAASTKSLPERVGPPPVQPVLARTAYRVPSALAPCDLRLDSNEGRAPLAELTLTPELLQRYPGTRALEVELARRHGVRPEEVLVTAGADDALQRLAAAYLAATSASSAATASRCSSTGIVASLSLYARPFLKPGEP